MADASRFPGLALPFAIVGATAGWLSGSMLVNPLVWRYADASRHDVPIIAAISATLFAAATGSLLRRWCAGRCYRYAFERPDPDTRLPSDRLWRHIALILAAGTTTGAVVSMACDVGGLSVGSGVAFLCTLAFVPVCIAVLAAARRAQRARLGSIVA